ncbi:3'(2'),5'-bisphosphate nucleotidase CysQ [Salinarimonas ramus]|uniref:3'(2'),5'-bisphosphate nucleotidase CysQ n=1 Tax=Salinarimonas ramus TaxID=690164 RepID=A0A917Q3Z2_9HYPH|nr:3'(2'),5'-bisphosphate nucleotidase CysQ [Salinarimonas ramus]GGK22089.1 3'(2'),5'-bisphosphate nucleotidase CysQ [Salinarimonas ramus]
MDEALTQAMIEAALAGGRAILAVASSGETDVRLKADRSPVTAADEAADAAIAAVLGRAFPEIAIVSEESAGERAPAQSGLFFLIDPLDGTKEFVAGTGEYTVNIALVDKGRAVAGVIHTPALGRICAGVVGEGAREAEVVDGAPGPWRTIRARTTPASAPVAVASRRHAGPRTEEFLASLGVCERASRGSSLKFCLLAAGEADVYPRLAPTMEWDTAAGHAILEAAGGRVERLDGTPLTYGGPWAAGAKPWANPDFVAWGARSA